MAEGARRGRPPRLTRETVARAVLEVGFPQLTFTAVRERLGVGESTLFRYAPDRDELVRLGLGLAMEAHPGSATEVSRGVFTLVMVRLSDELCSFLMECGFTARNALLTCDLVFDMVVDSRRGVEHMDGLSAEAGPERDYMKKQWVSDEPEESPVPGWKKIRQAKLEAVNLPPFDWFMKKLEVLLDGVAASLAPA